MSLDLSLFQIEDGLRDLYAMREEELDIIGSSDDAAAIFRASQNLEVLGNAIRDYIVAELKKVDGTADFILMLDRLCHEPRERKRAGKTIMERCELDREIDRLRARRDSLRGVMQHVKDAVKCVMEGMPWREGKLKKLEGVRHSIMLRGNGGAQPVEITDESLVPDEYRRVTVTMPLDLWQRVCREIGSDGVLRELGQNCREVTEIGKSAIAEALQKPCPRCHGDGTVSVGTLGEGGVDTCPQCGGSCLAGVPGARLAPRGESLIVR